MPIQETLVYAVKVDYYCEFCGEVTHHNGYTISSEGKPPLYPHSCKDGHTIKLPKVYPYIDYREVELGAVTSS